VASTDGSDFYGDRLSGNTGGWVERRLDLTDVNQLGDLTGQSQVWVALIFTSDQSVNNAEGAYVDNIVLRKSLTEARSQGGGQRGRQPGSELRTLPRLPSSSTLGTETERSGAVWSP